jgi:hypothetical protein
MSCAEENPSCRGIEKFNRVTVHLEATKHQYTDNKSGRITWTCTPPLGAPSNAGRWAQSFPVMLYRSPGCSRSRTDASLPMCYDVQCNKVILDLEPTAWREYEGLTKC